MSKAAGKRALRARPGTRLLALSALVLAAAFSAACSDLASVTGVGTAPPLAQRDSAPPDVAVISQPVLALGAPVGGEFTDDVGLKQVRFTLFGADSALIWTSPLLPASGRRDTVWIVPKLAAGTIPVDKPLQLLAWAIDSAGKERYAGTTPDAGNDQSKATRATVRFLPDTMFPAGEFLHERADTLTRASTVELSVHDDFAVTRAQFQLLDGATVVWASDTLRTTAKADTMVFDLGNLGEDLPSETPLSLVAWVQDSVHQRRFIGAPSDDPLNTDLASRQPVMLEHIGIAPGLRLVSLGAGSEIGGLALDRAGGVLWATDVPNNRVRRIRLSTGAVDADVFVGSRPTHLAFVPAAGGMGSSLVVFNSGSYEVSRVSLSAAGGSEVRPRATLPLLRIALDSTEVSVDPRLASLRTVCNDADCRSSSVFAISQPVRQGDFSLLRALDLSSGDLGVARVVAPDAAALGLSGDTAITITVSEEDLVTGALRELYTVPNASRCGALLFASPVMAASVDGPVYISESGAQPGYSACGGSSARVLRLSGLEASDVSVSPTSLIASDRPLALGEVRGLATNEDGALLLAWNENEIALIDSNFVRRSTESLSSITGAAFLPGARGDHMVDQYYAVAVPNAVIIYETRHHRPVRSLRTDVTLSGPLQMIERDGTITIISQTTEKGRILLLDFDRSELSR